MKLITRNTDYAVRALCFMAEQREKIISVSELARELKIPKPFLRKILQTLHKKKLLISYKGQGGGFSLASSPSNIFLVDLMEIFQGHLELNRCVSDNRICPNMKTCQLRKKMEAIEKHVASELGSLSIASLFSAF